MTKKTIRLGIIVVGLIAMGVNAFAVLQDDWHEVNRAEMPPLVSADFAVSSSNTLAAFNSQQGALSVYTINETITQRAVITTVPVENNLTFIASKSKKEITVTASNEKHDTLFSISFLPESDIIAFKPGKTKTLRIHDTNIRYGIIPSFIGVDLVYDPVNYENEKVLHVPAMNMFVGLIDDNDTMMVGVWDKGDQTVKLGLSNGGSKRLISDFSINMSEQNFYLAYITHQDIWHAEVLKDDYLEVDTEIEWKRPFDAKWIGRAYLKEPGSHYPIYFQKKRKKEFGRYISGRYIMPFWFEEDKTMLHFEKKYPPMGEALIYYLDNRGALKNIASPLGVIKKALGTGRALGILDWEGMRHFMPHEHNQAVCAMLTEVLEEGTSYYDDIVTFIDVIRKRLRAFLVYSKELEALLDGYVQANPGLAQSVTPLRESLEKMQDIKGRIPSESLDEIREWTVQLKEIKGSDQLNEKEWRKRQRLVTDVAGTQDGLAMEFSWIAINIMEQSAELAVTSLGHCKLAEQVIAKTRKILRNGSQWEPNRYYPQRPGSKAPAPMNICSEVPEPVSGN